MWASSLRVGRIFRVIETVEIMEALVARMKDVLVLIQAIVAATRVAVEDEVGVVATLVVDLIIIIKYLCFIYTSRLGVAIYITLKFAEIGLETIW